MKFNTPYSPSASDSSFSVSTCDSPFLSILQSEVSPIAGTPSLQSPPLMFHTHHHPGNATKQSKSFSQEEVMNARTLPNVMPIEMIEKHVCHASGLHVSTKYDSFVKDTERLVQSPDVDGSKWLSDKDWPSNGTESWASASSQELLWNSGGPAANDSDEMPKLTPNTSPVLTMGIRQGDSPSWNMSEEESRDWVLHSPDDIKTGEWHTYNPRHGDGHRSRWNSSIQRGICTEDDEGCSRAHDDECRRTTCSAPLGDYTSPSSFSNGQFRLVEQDGSTCYSFSVHESDEVFFARACNRASGSDKDDRNGFYYAFRCKREEPKGGWNCWFRKEKLASSTLVGQMKVSAARYIDGKRIDNKSRIEETHFVLFDERCQQPAAEREGEEDDQLSAQHLFMQSSKAISRAHKSLEKSMIKAEKVYVELLAVAITSTSTKTHTDTGNYANHDSSGRDDAAFVDLKYSQKSRGLRYLSKSSEKGFRLRNIEGLHAQTKRSRRRNEQSAAVNVVVILPAGRHGNGKCSGPTPLLECWRLDGKCDCGGWDLGCGLSVLRADVLKLPRTSTIALTNRDRINWILPGRPLMIFSQGHKRRKILEIEAIQAGLFSLSFQAQFSPLQAFATAVAIFHQQISSE